MELQDLYQKAINFAGNKHADQKVPGSNASYLVHLSNVAMEIMIAARHTDDFDLDFAVQVALLHDVLEDTSTTFDELREAFGHKVARSVLALSKNEDLPVSEQIIDSLARIKSAPKEVWAVKLADRISNMQKPPPHWDINQVIDYKKMAGIILLQLKGGNAYLEQRLFKKIEAYKEYI